jgi:hypothetical protein
MNSPTTKVLFMVASILLGAIADHIYLTEQYRGYVELHMTKSGTFVLNKGQIYTVSELLSEEHQAVNLIGRR